MVWFPGTSQRWVSIALLLTISFGVLSLVTRERTIVFSPETRLTVCSHDDNMQRLFASPPRPLLSPPIIIIHGMRSYGTSTLETNYLNFIAWQLCIAYARLRETSSNNPTSRQIQYCNGHWTSGWTSGRGGGVYISIYIRLLAIDDKPHQLCVG